jgi:hypothetical protein
MASRIGAEGGLLFIDDRVGEPCPVIGSEGDLFDQPCDILA